MKDEERRHVTHELMNESKPNPDSGGTNSASLQPIATGTGLAALIGAVEHSREICLDTEADSLHHYFEKLCLLQFTITDGGTGEGSNFLLDPLAKLDLAPLFAALKDKPLVLHGADYDLRMLKTDFDFVPCEIFDTMLAARLAGQTVLGLGGLVERYAGGELDHGVQKADWSQRPLPPRLLKYAVEDTMHLPLIAGNLRSELAALGRTEWHRQQCAQLIELSVVVRSRDPDDIWRIRGSFDLDRASLAILRELWHWRDAEARGWDRPCFMVVSNDKLLELTAWAREHPGGDLNQGPVLPKRWPPRRFQSLHATLQRAAAVPEAEWPQPVPRGKRPPYDPSFSSRMSRLRAARDATAREQKLDPSILVPNAMLEAIASQQPAAPEDFAKIDRWLPWQTELLGAVFLGVLHPQPQQ